MKHYFLERIVKTAAHYERTITPVRFWEGKGLLKHYAARDRWANDGACAVNERALCVRVKAAGYYSKTHLIRA